MQRLLVCSKYCTYSGQKVSRLLGAVVVTVVLPPRDDLQHHDAEAERIRLDRVVPAHHVFWCHVPTETRDGVLVAKLAGDR